MIYSAAYRSLIDTILILILTIILDDQVFSKFIAEYYPIYFIANLLFSSATTDLAGGRREIPLTIFLLTFASPCILIWCVVQHEGLILLFYLTASLTAIDSVAFVICESIAHKINLIYTLIPRLFMLTVVIAMFIRNDSITLESLLEMFIIRDFIMVIIGLILLTSLRKEVIVKIGVIGNDASKVAYLFLSNAHDFLLRILINIIMGPVYLKTFEYALRLPRVAQVGLMFLVRHRIFTASNEVTHKKKTKMNAMYLIVMLCAVTCLYGYIYEYFKSPYLVIASALLATSAVPWYTEMLNKRKFLYLSIVQAVTFCITILSVSILNDAYLSICCMTFTLFIFAYCSNFNHIKIYRRY